MADQGTQGAESTSGDDAAEMTSILADLAASRSDDDGDAAPAPAPADSSAPAAGASAAPAADADDDDDAAPDGDAPGAAVAPKPAIQDPETQKRIAAVQKAEKASKQAIAAERQAFAAERAEWEARNRPMVEKIASFEKLLGRVKYAPADVLEMLGLTPDRFEDASRDLYARSPKGAADPRAREASERALRERERGDELAKLRAEMDEMRTAASQREATAAAERDAQRFLSGVVTAAKASAEAPLIARMLAKNPAKAERALASIALTLAEETGEMPDAADVIATYEKRRREELDELGVDVDQFIKTKPKTKDKAADEQKPAATLGNNPSATTQARRSEPTEADEDAAILAELAKLRASAGDD